MSAIRSAQLLRKKPLFTMYKSKVSPSRRLKNILKPLLSQVFKLKTNQKEKRSSYIASDEKESEFEWLHNDMDNMSNEHLENQLIEEMQQSDGNYDAIIVYDEAGAGELQSVDPDHIYVPVHFARNDRGTFFWTSICPRTVEPYAIEWNFHDRWAQA